MLDYPVILEAQSEGGFVVTFPDVPEAITQGEDEDEALLYAVDALETALSFTLRRANPCLCRARRDAGSGRCARRRWNAPSWAFIRR